MADADAVVTTAPLIARLLSERRREWLGERRSHLVLVLSSLALCSTSIGIGLRLDDHVYHVAARGGADAASYWATPPKPLDLFRLADADEVERRYELEIGRAPWFTSPKLKLAFARPLASLTHFVDYNLLDGVPWAMHLHSLFWLLLLGLSVARLVRELDSGWIAGLTLWMFLLDPGHGVPGGWLSSRNQLLAATLGALALHAHVRWRRGALPTPVPALAFAAAGFLAGESMLGWVGFFGAFALLLDPAGPRRGLLALLPLAGVVMAWSVAYAFLGYGASGSGMYVDPLTEPLHYSRLLVERLPQLLAGQLGGPPGGVFAMMGRPLELTAIGLAATLLFVIALVLVPLLRRDALARFWGAGALLATIPECATQPHPRLMLIAGLGTAGLVARFISALVQPRYGARPSGAAARVLALYWFVMLVVLSPPRLALEAWSAVLVDKPAALAARSVPAAASGKTLVVVSVPDPVFMCGHTGIALASLAMPRPKHFRCLAGVEDRATVTREDERTLVIRVPEGLMSPIFAPLLRASSDPFPEDWSLELSDVRYEIAERDETGRSIALRVRFHTALEDGERVFVVWSKQERAFRIFEPPAVGQRVEVEGQPLVDLFMSGD